jgi:hypothetical protein
LRFGSMLAAFDLASLPVRPLSPDNELKLRCLLCSLMQACGRASGTANEFP